MPWVGQVLGLWICRGIEVPQVEDSEREADAISENHLAALEMAVGILTDRTFRVCRAV